MKTYPHPFECEECSHRPDSDFRRFESTDSWVIGFPKKKQIHIHFGSATTSEKQSTEETQWLYDTTVAIGEKNNGVNFFVYIDVSRSDDTEFPSDKSQELYKKMLNLPQTDMAIFYGATSAMRFFIHLLIRFAKKGDKVDIETTKEKADARYEEWYKENGLKKGL